MEFNVSFDFFVDEDSVEPRYYWLKVTTAYDPDVIMLNGGGSATISPEKTDGNYQLNLTVQACDSSANMKCPVEHEVVLGNLPSSGLDCALELNVLLGNERIGGGLPKLANANQVAKPIEKLKI